MNKPKYLYINDLNISFNKENKIFKNHNFKKIDNLIYILYFLIEESKIKNFHDREICIFIICDRLESYLKILFKLLEKKNLYWYIYVKETNNISLSRNFYVFEYKEYQNILNMKNKNSINILIFDLDSDNYNTFHKNNYDFKDNLFLSNYFYDFILYKFYLPPFLQSIIYKPFGKEYLPIFENKSFFINVIGNVFSELDKNSYQKYLEKLNWNSFFGEKNSWDIIIYVFNIYIKNYLDNNNDILDINNINLYLEYLYNHV